MNTVQFALGINSNCVEDGDDSNDVSTKY